MRGISVLLGLATIALVLSTNSVSANDGDCHDDNLNLTIKRGETIYPEGQCLRMSCSDEGKLRPEPCMMAIPPGCRVVDGDMIQQWPGCCPTYKCGQT